MSTAYFFFADSKGMGLISHFSRQITDMFESPAREADFYVVSDKKEQNPGCWKLVREHIPERFIVEYDESDFAELRSRLKSLLENHTNVIFHIQGVNHIRNLKPLLRSPKVRSLVTVHSFAHGTCWKRPIVSSIYALLVLRYVNKIIFTSPFSKNLFWGATLLERTGKVLHIPFALADSPCSRNDACGRGFRGIYLANFFKHKQHEKYLNAVIEFCSKHKDAVFEFLGEGPCRRRVLEKIAAVGLSERILCPGRVSRTKAMEHLAASDVALVLSASETFGHNAIEPALMGVPVIATRVGAAEYFVQDFVNGFGISTPKDLGFALEFLYANPQARRDIGPRARAMAERTFDYSAMISELFAAYKSLTPPRINNDTLLNTADFDENLRLTFPVTLEKEAA